LHEGEEASLAKAQELENLQATKSQEIEDLQEELHEHDEELQEHEIDLGNKDNKIANLLAQIHQLQLQQAPATAAPAADPTPPVMWRMARFFVDESCMVG
jgi:chromosome segregation ATPase